MAHTVPSPNDLQSLEHTSSSYLCLVEVRALVEELVARVTYEAALVCCGIRRTFHSQRFRIETYTEKDHTFPSCRTDIDNEKWISVPYPT